MNERRGGGYVGSGLGSNGWVQGLFSGWIG